MSGVDMTASKDHAKVHEPTLKSLVGKEMAHRADNVFPGSKASMEHVEILRQDIRDFKAQNNLDRVIIQ